MKISLATTPHCTVVYTQRQRNDCDVRTYRWQKLKHSFFNAHPAFLQVKPVILRVWDTMGHTLYDFVFEFLYTVRNYLHGLQNSGESIEDSDLHTDFGPITW